MGIEEIQEQVLRLPPEARASLARALLNSLDSMSEAQVAALWAEEAHRRDEELDQGRATAVPADEVLARARARRK